MADFKDIKLSDGEKIQSGNSDVDKLDDFNEAEFRGATLSLTQENSQSPPLIDSTISNAGPAAVSAVSVEVGTVAVMRTVQRCGIWDWLHPAFAISPICSRLRVSPAIHESFLRVLRFSGSRNPNPNVDKNENQDSLPPGMRSHRPSTAKGLSSENIREFFANGALENVAEQCRPVILENLDGELRGVWLLTEIDHWDTEKERVLFLTDYSLISLKYDFITLKLLDYKRLHLKEFDSIVIGELKYPDGSLMPKINGAVDFIKGRVIPKIRQARTQGPAQAPEPEPEIEAPSPTTLPTSDDPRPRNQIGARCKWNAGQPLPFLKSWNPWSREIPWVTYTSHPLVKHEGLQKTSYDIEDFAHNLAQTIEQLDLTKAPPHDMLTPLKTCDIEYQPIMIENYAGVVAAFHNANDFGFFKSRGKVSF